MPSQLPSRPAPRKMTPYRVSAQNVMTPDVGLGPDQRINRPGTRYAVIYEMPPMRYEAAQDWADIDDESDTVVMRLIQPGIDTGSPGSAVVDGAGQAGAILKLKGLTPSYPFRKNQWISVIIGGQRFCYRVKQETVVGVDGKVSLPLRTLLRKPPPDNAIVEVAEPKIEGFATIPEDAWAVGVDRLVYLTVTIREVE